MDAYRLKNKEKIALLGKRYAQENRAKVRKVKADWAKRNPEKQRAAIRNWQENNKERFSEKKKQWRQANKVSLRIHCANRRRKLAEGVLSKDIIGKLLKLQRGKCACCGEPLGTDFHLDHRMPIALGGANADDNVQLLTKRCNLTKNAKHPIDFMRERGFLL